MKIPQFFRHKKLRAGTARRASAPSAGMDFGDIPEPNMKLSRALLIVLLLHVVAVSGIIAFNAIKTRQSSFVAAAPENAENTPTISPTVTLDTSSPRSAAAQKENVPRDEARTSGLPSKPPAKDDPRNRPDTGKCPPPLEKFTR